MLKWWKNFLKRLEAANKKEFGNKKLDCCALNRKTNKVGSKQDIK